MSDTNEAIKKLWDAMNGCDVDPEEIRIGVYNRSTANDATYRLGENVDDGDAEYLGMDPDDLRALVSLDGSHEYRDNTDVSAYVDVPPLDITFGDPDRNLAAVNDIIDDPVMVDSSIVKVYVADQNGGDTAEFDYGETITEYEVDGLYDVDSLDDYDEVERELQDVVNLDGYELPGEMLVLVDINEASIM